MSKPGITFGGDDNNCRVILVWLVDLLHCFQELGYQQRRGFTLVFGHQLFDLMALKGIQPIGGQE